jgi:hypothetical protein
MPVHFCRGKAAQLSGWQHRRPEDTSDDQLGHWFGNGDDFNVGGALGALAGGVVDLDLDCTEAVIASRIISPDTKLIFGRRSHPDSHRFYRVTNPGAREDYSDPITKESAVELRASGCQTVLPLSRHETTGELIEFSSLGEPGESDWATLSRVTRHIAIAALLGRYFPRGESNRHQLLLHFSGMLALNNFSLDAASNIVQAVCLIAGDDVRERVTKCTAYTYAKIEKNEEVTGFPAFKSEMGAELAPVADQLYEWIGPVPIQVTSCSTPVSGMVMSVPAAPRPATPPKPYRPFPVEVLPATIAALVLEGAAAMRCDPAYIALPALVAVAGVIGNTREIRLKRTWTEPSVLWAAVIAESGTMKTPAHDLATRPVRGLDRELSGRYEDMLETFRKEKSAYEMLVAKNRKEGKVTDSAPPEMPAKPRLVTRDATIESLAVLLADNPRGLILDRDELSGWFMSFRRYKSGAGCSDTPHWLEMNRAGSLLVDRKHGDRPSIRVPRAAVSVTGTIQPGTLARALTAEYFEAGLPARILLAMPPTVRKEWSEDDVHPDTLQRYEDLLRSLLSLELDSDAGGHPVPFTVKLTSAAKGDWIEFYNEWGGRQYEAERERAAMLSKLEAYAARLALIHHVVTHVGSKTDPNDPVEPVSIAAGIALVRWFAYEAGRVYDVLGETEPDRQVRTLVETVRRKGGAITARALHRNCASRYKTVDAAERALTELVQSGLAEWEDRCSGPNGGRPTRLAVLRRNDETDETSTEGDDEDDPDGDIPTPKPTTKPPSIRRNPPTQPANSAVSEGSVGFVVSSVVPPSPPVPPSSSPPAETSPEGGFRRIEEGFVVPSEVLAPAPTPSLPEIFIKSHPQRFALVTHDAELHAMVQFLADSAGPVAVDTETLGLRPKEHRLRLIQAHGRHHVRRGRIPGRSCPALAGLGHERASRPQLVVRRGVPG